MLHKAYASEARQGASDESLLHACRNSAAAAAAEQEKVMPSSPLTALECMHDSSNIITAAA
jgi:hypothetical protein